MGKEDDWPLQGLYFLHSFFEAKERDPDNDVAWNKKRFAEEALKVSQSTLNRYCSGETPIPVRKFRIVEHIVMSQVSEPVVSGERSQFEDGYRFLAKVENGTTAADQTIPEMVRKFLVRQELLSDQAPPLVSSIKQRSGSKLSNEAKSTPSTAADDGGRDGGPGPKSRRSNLPQRLNDFVGQNEAVATIKTSLMQEQNVLLAGMGGVGKTSLSIEFAHSNLRDFPGGIFFVDAQGMSHDPYSSVEVARTLAQAIDPVVQPERQSDWIDVLEMHLAKESVLLIMDNLWSADTIRELRVPSSTRILATARKRLAVSGFQIVDIDEMSMADATALLKLILGPLKLKQDQLEELAKECGALPLALRAAATFVMVYKVPLDEYLKRLRNRREEQVDRRLSYLSEARELDKALDVQAVLSLSLEKLLEDDRVLALRYLDLVQFPADFDSSVISAIWNTETDITERSLDRLVAQSLVQREQKSGRLRIHDLLKEMAEGQLVS